MAGSHSGHKRGIGAPLVVLVLLVVAGGAGLYYSAAQSGVYRATMGAKGTKPEEITLDGDREWLERNGVVYLRIEHRRDYPVWGMVKSAETWDRARVAQLRNAQPQLTAFDCWPNPEEPHGGVAWVSE